MQVNKWYFATNVHGLRWAFNQIKVAVISAKANTKLEAYALVDDTGSDEGIEERIAWLSLQGVTVIRHRATLVSELVPIFGETMNVYSGHWLRCDIPLIEKSAEAILYTDIDVVFRSDVSELAFIPKVIACAPEHNRGDYSYFNSGVMLINIPAMAERADQMKAVLRSRLSHTAPYDDQAMLNELFAAEWEHLSDLWNWKPYWGVEEKSHIVHWHGPKPNHVVEMLAGETGKFGDDYHTIFKKNPQSYGQHLIEFNQYAMD